MTSDLPIAVRVYPDLPSSQPDRKTMPEIDGMLVFDCETRTDKAQALTFGSYRFLVEGRCLEEGLFYGDDLLPRELTTLERYACEHSADTNPRGIPERSIPSNPELLLLSAAEFRTLLYRVTYKGRGLLFAFNFPFDTSRLALDYGASQDRFLGGFRFHFFQYRDAAGKLRPIPTVPGSQSSTWIVNARSKALPPRSIPIRKIRYPKGLRFPSRRMATFSGGTCSMRRRSPSRSPIRA